jgi:hypothetical protein
MRVPKMMSSRLRPANWFRFTLISFVIVIESATSAKLTAPETWRRPPGNVAAFFRDRLSSETYSEVVKPFQNDALTHLASVSFKEIDPHEAQAFSGGGLNVGEKPGVRVFLVRAVRCGSGGRFTIFRQGNALYVSHGDLGLEKARYRSVLVVALDSVLSDVFYDCTVVQ